MSATITYTATHTYLECEICESNPNPNIDFSFMWPRHIADTITDTIEAIQFLHNQHNHNTTRKETTP